MDTNTNQKHWDELKDKLRTKFPQLTETDLQHKAGMEEDMLRMVEYKLSKTKQELQIILNIM